MNMPRRVRIDAPGALHHVIIRGIERRKIFRSDYDRTNFVGRLAELIPETTTECFVWAILENHVHIARRLKIGQPAASRLTKRSEQIEKENEFDLIPDKGLKT